MMEMEMNDKKRGPKEKRDKSAASGVVALVFLIVGFQAALFYVKVVDRPVAQESVVDAESSEDSTSGGDYDGRVVDGTGRAAPVGDKNVGAGRAGRRYNSSSSAERTKFGGYPAPESSFSRPELKKKKSVESFRFDPNTVSVDDLVRLGLSSRQADVILNYREKGGSFRRKEDFKKMYVVSDTLYRRLEPYIDIPKVELNTADSTALVSLRGIGPYYARKILAFRERLGGFYSVNQLLEIDGFDGEKLEGFSDAVTVDPKKIRRLAVRTCPGDSLAMHPYIGTSAARGIMRLRNLSDSSDLSMEVLVDNGIIRSDRTDKLRFYLKMD